MFVFHAEVPLILWKDNANRVQDKTNVFVFHAEVGVSGLWNWVFQAFGTGCFRPWNWVFQAFGTGCFRPWNWVFQALKLGVSGSETFGMS